MPKRHAPRLALFAVACLAFAWPTPGYGAAPAKKPSPYAATTASNGVATGLVNVNTASYAVLSAIPGIGPENAAALVAFRAANPDQLTSFAWLTQVMTPGNIRTAGRYITGLSYQFSVDVAGVGAKGRGYCRAKVVFDMSTGRPRIVNRQDYTHFGWALGTATRRLLNGTNDI